MHTKTKVKLILGLIVTLIIVYLSVKSLSGLHPGKLLHENINWFYVAISILIYAFSNYVRGFAYTRGIDPNISILNAVQIVAIGHAANMVLPLHAGEGLRLVFFPSDYNALRRTHLLIIPAYADFIAIMLLALLAVPFAGFTNPTLLKVLWILSILCIAGVLFSFAAVFLVKRLHNYFKEYLNRSLAKMMFWVVLSWVLLLISTWFGLIAFRFGAVESIRFSLAVFATTNIINFIPASPGAIGLFEYGTILGMGGLGVDQTTALAASLLLHLIQYLALLPMAVILYIMALHGKYGNEIKKYFSKSKD